MSRLVRVIGEGERVTACAKLGNGFSLASPSATFQWSALGLSVRLLP